MTSSVSQELASGLAEVEQLIPTLVFVPAGGSKSYPCTPGDIMAGSTLGQGGWGSSTTVDITVRFAVLATPPVVKSKVSLNGRVLRVDDITTGPEMAFFVLHCVDPTRGV